MLFVIIFLLVVIAVALTVGKNEAALLHSIPFCLAWIAVGLGICGGITAAMDRPDLPAAALKTDKSWLDAHSVVVSPEKAQKPGHFDDLFGQEGAKPALKITFASDHLTFVGAQGAETVMTDEEICNAMKAMQSKMAAELPMQIDSITTTHAMAVVCDLKIIKFKQRLAATSTQMKAGWQKRKQSIYTQMYCNDESSKAAIRNGWAFMNSLTMADNVLVTFVADTCP